MMGLIWITTARPRIAGKATTVQGSLCVHDVTTTGFRRWSDVAGSARQLVAAGHLPANLAAACGES